MRTSTRSLLALPVVAALIALSSTVAAAQDDFRWTGTVAAGDHIEIKGVNGRVIARPASGNEIAVRATKRARRSNPAEVTIEVVEHADGVTICAVYPTPSGRQANECVPGEGGRNSTRDNDVRVEFVVDVPDSVGFVGRTVNGAVEVGALTGDVRAHTVNGSVEIERARHARAETVNGSVTALMTAADWTDLIEFRTVNGSVTVMLPDATSADVDLRTVNGRIETDFALTVSGRVNPRRLRGTIGGGGRSLRAETVNGSIRLLQRN